MKLQIQKATKKFKKKKKKKMRTLIKRNYVTQKIFQAGVIRNY